jgi:hypothetical protein
MATVPGVITYSAGSVLTAAQLNTYLSAAVTFIIAPPLCVMRQTVTQALTSTIYAPITFDTEDIDRDNGHSTTTNPSRYTAQTQGWYAADGCVSFISGSASARGAKWTVNGADIGAAQFFIVLGGASTSQINPPSRKIFLNVGDYLEMQGNSFGTTPTTNSGTVNQSGVSIQWSST